MRPLAPLHSPCTIYELPGPNPTVTGPSEHFMLAYELDIDKIGASRGHHGFGIFVYSAQNSLDKHVRSVWEPSLTPPGYFII